MAFRDYRNFKTIRNLSDKIRELITGNYTDDIHVVGDPDLVELAQHINDLSKVFRLTHENLAQEKNRLASILTYMTDGVLATDRAGNITMINETAQRQLNLKREEAIKLNIIDILNTDRAYTYHELVSQTLEA